jgi:hypothetical protein
VASVAMPQRLTSISGFGLVRILFNRGYVPSSYQNEATIEGSPAQDWQYRFLALEGAGTLMWYTDESQLFPESFAAITSEAQNTGKTTPSQECILRFEANLGTDGRVATIEIAVAAREVQIWLSILAYHLDEAEEFGTVGTTATFNGNREKDHDDDADINLLTNEHMDAVITISLKNESHSLSLPMTGDANLMATTFVNDKGIKNDFSIQIEVELLRAQLELYRSRESQLLSQYAKVQRKVHGIVVAEAHASMAESLASELTEALSKVRTKIVPDLQNKIKLLESSNNIYSKETEEAQTQLARSENNLIAENVKLKQEVLHLKQTKAHSFSRNTTPNKSPGNGNGNGNGNTTANTSTTSDIDSLLGNVKFGSPHLASFVQSPDSNSNSNDDNNDDKSKSPSNSVHSRYADKKQIYGNDEVNIEVQELRKMKVHLMKQLRHVQDELNVTKYELNEAYGKKAEQRKMLNFSDIIDSNGPDDNDMTNSELRIKLYKQTNVIESLKGSISTLEKSKEIAITRSDEFAAKLDIIETRYNKLQKDNKILKTNFLELSNDYDVKTIKNLENDNYRLREEVVKFRGEVLKLKHTIDSIGGNNNNYTGTSTSGLTTSSSSAGASTSTPSRVLVIDEYSEKNNNNTNNNSNLNANPKELTPRSALLNTYPMIRGGGGNMEDKLEYDGNSSINSINSSNININTNPAFATPYSDQHAHNPNKPIDDYINTNKTDTSVKWLPKEKDALSQRLSPVVEDRLLRVIYHRYVHEHKGPSSHDIMLANLPSHNNGSSSAAFAHAASDASKFVSNNTMTLGRFIRFAKEFHLCYVGGNKSGSSKSNGSSNVTCTPPYLVSGEIDVIFHNSAKLKVPNDISSNSKLRPYGFRAGGGTDRQYQQYNQNGTQTTGLSLTPGQFMEAVKIISCKLYSNIIELQTGTLLECLPPRQQKAASRAVYDVLIKKKILPICDKLGLVPWPLIYLEQSVNIFREFKVTHQCLSTHFPQLLLWFDQYKSTYKPPSASAILLSKSKGNSIANNNNDDKIYNNVHVGITYKSMSQYAKDFGIVPYLMKEPQLYGLFQEFMLWSTMKPEELHKTLPMDVVRRTTRREKGEDEEEAADFLHFGQNEDPLPFGGIDTSEISMSTAATTSPVKVGHTTPGNMPKSPHDLTRRNNNFSAEGASVQSPAKESRVPIPISCGLPKASTSSCRLGLLSFVQYFSTIAQESFPNYAPEHRIFKLFELCAQSGGGFASRADNKNN